MKQFLQQQLYEKIFLSFFFTEKYIFTPVKLGDFIGKTGYMKDAEIIRIYRVFHACFHEEKSR
jgi:hypothetical protein